MPLGGCDLRRQALTDNPPSPADYLLTAAAVRERCGLVFAAAERGETRHFALDLDRLDEAVARVVSVTRRRYPDLVVPFHSRWRHFSVGGVDRARLVAPGADPAETARARLDLAIVSVLLDAGAGPHWRYREAETGQVLGRSEGLAVASLRAMQEGLFSADPRCPWRADAAALASLSAARLGEAFQHSAGKSARRPGGQGLAAAPPRRGRGEPSRPVRLAAPGSAICYDFWLAQTRRPARPGDAAAAAARVWPDLAGAPVAGRRTARRLRPAPRRAGRSDFVPFHKLSQWLVYSLIEPLADAGFTVTGIDGLTGLAEYRNGGLFIDTGVIVARDPELPRRTLDPFAEEVVEWRALTVALLDRLAERVRERLGFTPSDFPLARVLEGGSWAAGREIAAERRPGGAPPLLIASDGTVF